MWFPVIFLLAGISYVLAVAPGDFESRCRSNSVSGGKNLRDFPDNWKILMDTYDYRQLYQPAGRIGRFWVNKDIDGDGQTFLLLGGTCSPSSYSSSPISLQNNWLFSQLISYSDAREIHLNVSFQSFCYGECVGNVTMYRQDSTNTIISEEQLNTDRYQPFLGRERESRLPQDNSVTKIMKLARPQSDSFFLGVKDSGTTGVVGRILVYYTVCKSKQVELVMYPEVPTPPQDAQDDFLEAGCVDHAHNLTSLQVNMFSSNSSCRDVAVGGARCECNAGYQISSKRLSCQPCQVGTYRALGVSTTCISCPANTLAGLPSAQRCECQSNYFRAPSETIGEACTTSPSRVLNLTIDERNDTTLHLSWDSPQNLGGRTDLYYEICYSLSTCTGSTSCDTTCTLKTASRVCKADYALDHLEPFTKYDIFVYTHNGVSEQDPDNADRQIARTSGSTTEGVPNAPSLHRLCTVVIWQPPTLPAGIISLYELRFISSSGVRETFTYDSTKNFQITTPHQQTNNVLVQIRGRNSRFYGPWSSLLPINCSNAACPTLPPAPPTTNAPPESTTHQCDEGNYLELKGVRFNDGDTIDSREIGEGNADALLLHTNAATCCTSPRVGQFRYPNNTIVGTNSQNQVLYRNRGSQKIRLNYRDHSRVITTGVYKGEIFNSSGDPCIIEFLLE